MVELLLHFCLFYFLYYDCGTSLSVCAASKSEQFCLEGLERTADLVGFLQDNFEQQAIFNGSGQLHFGDDLHNVDRSSSSCQTNADGYY